ncbi:tetraspanin-1-like, partial [Clarias magur]
FFIIILIMFIMEVVAVAIVLSNPKAEEQVEQLRKKVTQSIKNSYGKDDTVTKAWDGMMKLMECCGYNNYTDFTESEYVKTNKQYPQYCCPEKENEKCDLSKARSEDVSGCFDTVVELVKDNSARIAGVVFGIVALEIAAMIVSMILYKSKPRNLQIAAMIVSMILYKSKPRNLQIAGAVTVIVGILIEMKGKVVLEALNNNKDIPPDFVPWFTTTYLLIAIGAVLAFMGFLGCCGACCENKCMLMIFFIIIFSAFVVEVVVGVLFLLHQSKAEILLDSLRTKVSRNIMENYGGNNIMTKAWNETMSLMKCCGYNNYTDFNDSPQVRTTSLYPPSCCSERKDECDLGQAKSKLLMGCFDTLREWVKNNSFLVGGVAVYIIAIE